MIRRRQLLAAAALAAPAIVERANAQSAFDWKQFKGQSIEVNVPECRRAAPSRRRTPASVRGTDR